MKRNKKEGIEKIFLKVISPNFLNNMKNVNTQIKEAK